MGMTIVGQVMTTRAELYREKAETCRRRAELVRNDLSETGRWRKLAEQWLKMADEAEQGRNPPCAVLGRVGSTNLMLR
jgi:hypothetical protein